MNIKSDVRSKELTHTNDEFLRFKTDYERYAADQAEVQANKEKILQYFDAAPEDWNDWHWQLGHRFSKASELAQIFALTEERANTIESISGRFRWAVTPYYLAQIRSFTDTDPFLRQSIPAADELDEWGETDPMGEEFTNPAGVITRRYPDRLIMNVTNCCPMFCRHCQRRRNIGEGDTCAAASQIDESIAYIKEHPEIRDVLVTGGDALTLSDAQLEGILQRLRAIPHVEIIRLGTRTLVTLPQRITDSLVKMLKEYAPIYINTQFNHPLELTEESQQACRKLADNGIVLGNQMVFLNGVNNDAYLVRLMNQWLLKNRVRPYYIFHPKTVIGTRHFQIPLSEGMDIVRSLRGNTSGMAIPTYVYNSKNGWGKIPICPESLEAEQDQDYVYIKTWEGHNIKIKK